MEPLYSDHHWGTKFSPLSYRGVALSQGLICTKRVHLGLSEVTFIDASGVAFKRGSSVVPCIKIVAKAMAGNEASIHVYACIHTCRQGCTSLNYAEVASSVTKDFTGKKRAGVAFG